MFNNLISKIKKNLPVIIPTVIVGGLATTAAVIYYRTVAKDAAVGREISEILNAGLADGTFSMIPGEDGIIHIVETASL